MAKSVRAVFDGQVLRPEEPVDLKTNARYLVTIEREEVRKEKGYLLNEGNYRHALLVALNNIAMNLQALKEEAKKSNENLKSIGSVLEDFTG